LSDSDILSSSNHAAGRHGPPFDWGGRRLVQFRHRGADAVGKPDWTGRRARERCVAAPEMCACGTATTRAGG